MIVPGSQILVTGAAGFVGSWLCRRLVDDGHEVTALVRRPPEPESLFQRLGLLDTVRVIQSSDPTELSTLIGAAAPQAVVNLAGMSQVRDAIADPAAAFEANVGYLGWLLRAVDGLPGAKPVVVQASTDFVYGETGAEPVPESAALRAAGPYEASKAASELLARSFARARNLPVVIARFGNIYGPGDGNRQRLIPRTIARVKAGEPADLRDGGLAVRAYLHVDDAVEAIRALIVRGRDPGVAGEAFNIAGGRGYPSLEIAQLIHEALGRADLQPLVRNDAPGEISVKVSRIDKARDALGFKPSVPLGRGLPEVCRHALS
jgi:CDP-glucose 4,6-dehydratase